MLTTLETLIEERDLPFCSEIRISITDFNSAIEESLSGMPDILKNAAKAQGNFALKGIQIIADGSVSNGIPLVIIPKI